MSFHLFKQLLTRFKKKLEKTMSKSLLLRRLWQLGGLFLIGCSYISDPTKDPLPQTAHEQRSSNFGKLFGDLTFFPLGKADKPVIGVNTYLWRACLDALSFMPLASADPFGGVIITDWYASPKSPKERFKVNVLIMGRQLRSNAIQLKLFRQIYEKDQWKDTSINPLSTQALEETIFKRARYLKAHQKT